MKLARFTVSALIGCMVCRAQTYRYDDAGRLLGVTYATGQNIGYTYDNAGNLLTVTPGTTATTGADLELSDLIVSPTAVTTRAFTACTFNLVNHGPLALNTASILVSFYLSTNTVFGDSDDVKIGDTTLSASIAAGASSSVSLSAGRLISIVRLWPSNQPAGNYYLFANATISSGTPSDSAPSNNVAREVSRLTYTPTGTPVISVAPTNLSVANGTNLALAAAGSGSPAPTYSWQQNGLAISGAAGPTLAIADMQPADAGTYTVELTSGTMSAEGNPVILGLTSTQKVVGAAAEVASNIVHPNGNVYDQVLLQGSAAAVMADYLLGQVTRTSYIDLTGDIVQVEFAGPGTLSLVLEDASGPALPVKYNQAVAYMQGHAAIIITGANEFTNVSVFSVGRANAVNQALFRGNVNYDGIADLAYIAIISTDGKFGGVRAADANFFAANGLTGVYAPGVQFVGPVYVGNITAFDAARPVLVLGSAPDTRITGGDLSQDNGASVQVSGITQLKFVDGSDSQGRLLPAQTNQAVLEDSSGLDVTAQIIVDPTP